MATIIFQISSLSFPALPSRRKFHMSRCRNCLSIHPSVRHASRSMDMLFSAHDLPLKGGVFARHIRICLLSFQRKKSTRARISHTGVSTNPGQTKHSTKVIPLNGGQSNVATSRKRTQIRFQNSRSGRCVIIYLLGSQIHFSRI